MALHAQRQRIAAQPAEEGVLRAHDRADVAHELGAALRGECGRGQIGIDEAVVALIRRIKGGIALIALEDEVAAVHDHAAEGGRVAVEIFGRRMDDDVRAQRERAAKDGRDEGVVHDEQHVVLFRDRGDLAEIEHFDGGIGDRLGEDELRAAVNQFFDLLGGRIRVEEAALDAVFRQRDRKEVEGTAVDRRRGDDVVARVAQGQREQRDRRHAGRAADRRDAALQLGNFALECGDRRVREARIKITVRFQIEQIRHPLRAVIIERGALHDGRDAGLTRLRAVTALYTNRILFISHNDLLLNRN